ncbi:uncharacterized protein E0L32_002714 [Thyridium curvatum]|uniref:UDENN FLCN/SMCR8-type domain-containing protein n=1 Tax=Thyridium curvatum TaxID=1093900 RepID=A0A507B4Z3_9PEZI|nr:uncharacterized protein E0L32_002714 [Thyridium curvatum]TPX18205.1 hypothetical protein E0L32_002714 [Thyridium curvatum]
MLISNMQLCLAHYCDVHGPTPLMVTEGLPVPCSACYDPDSPSISFDGDRPQTAVPSAQATAAITDVLKKMDLGGLHRSSSSPVSEQEAQTHRAALLRSTQLAHAPASAVETPPVSPRRSTDQERPLPPRRDSSFRKTYDDYVTKRANPCDNCAMTLPRRQETSATGPRKGKSIPGGDSRNPTLRTRAPCARVFGSASGDESPPSSQTASSSDTDGDDNPKAATYAHRRSTTVTSSTSRSSGSSTPQYNSHTHYLDYTSTHEPMVANSFSIVRASCLRTLSFEMLPRNAGAASGSANATPVASPQTPSFVTTHSAGAAASGGPIFFGDPAAGYTTAYIFRIPDIHARGHKRVYAFLALSTQRERLAMKTFGFVAAAFHDLAVWIQQLAEAEADRALNESSATSSPVVANPNYGPSPFSPVPPQTPQGSSNNSGGSSFLAAAGGGLSRRMGTGFGVSGNPLKARGLAEIVGMPDFFIELHSRFVRLLLELGVVLNS